MPSMPVTLIAGPACAGLCIVSFALSFHAAHDAPALQGTVRFRHDSALPVWLAIVRDGYHDPITRLVQFVRPSGI